ncbi:hypothetical protein GQ55_9G537800 [Panicum hallii var. hallii]|uniref:Uncharacterized protein n=1 Tax=Panicum hallii var. hallii TaxID=1504633 RepID=A0A2T7CEX9_9POAL|nr:hypothetical protein GQ55_9G537800 [Panicum hallii var. hallii]
MAEVVDLPPRREGLLEVSLTCPRMCGYAGPAWPRFCFVYVSFRDKVVCPPKMLPFELDEEDVDEDISERDIRRYVRAQAMEDIKRWRLPIRIPMVSGWVRESLDIHVERVDQDMRRRRDRDVVVTRGGPHTSQYIAVIGRARVPLLDALVIGDDDEEEEAEDQKRRRRSEVEESPSRVEGTLEFGKTVPLLDWELPAPRDAGGKPRSVVRGSVDVRMNLRRLA